MVYFTCEVVIKKSRTGYRIGGGEGDFLDWGGGFRKLTGGVNFVIESEIPPRPGGSKT